MSGKSMEDRLTDTAEAVGKAAVGAVLGATGVAAAAFGGYEHTGEVFGGARQMFGESAEALKRAIE